MTSEKIPVAKFLVVYAFLYTIFHFFYYLGSFVAMLVAELIPAFVTIRDLLKQNAKLPTRREKRYLIVGCLLIGGLIFFTSAFFVEMASPTAPLIGGPEPSAGIPIGGLLIWLLFRLMILESTYLLAARKLVKRQEGT